MFASNAIKLSRCARQFPRRNFTRLARTSFNYQVQGQSMSSVVVKRDWDGKWNRWSDLVYGFGAFWTLGVVVAWCDVRREKPAVKRLLAAARDGNVSEIKKAFSILFYTVSSCWKV
ncbi:unnamed protein product [Notodromas monacha]|uniref:Uncharacterized protein n=1 Tax=Notodromas monacha TaxID=399045 RepID=A0A7R9BRV1_9CRUS|nr:unnamed protein product [Notodromas monacha]CAG0920521.1 unnamed protein product [Notodromas monacha]